MLRTAIPTVILMVAASLGLSTPTAVASPARPLAEVHILPNARLAAEVFLSLRYRIALY